MDFSKSSVYTLHTTYFFFLFFWWHRLVWEADNISATIAQQKDMRITIQRQLNRAFLTNHNKQKLALVFVKGNTWSSLLLFRDFNVGKTLQYSGKMFEMPKDGIHSFLNEIIYSCIHSFIKWIWKPITGSKLSSGSHKWASMQIHMGYKCIS